MEVGPIRIHLIIGSNKNAGSLLFDFKDDGSLTDLRDRAVAQFEIKYPESNFSEALLTVRDGPSLLPGPMIFNQMRERKKANKPMEMNLTIDGTSKEDPLDIAVREVAHSISVNAATNVDQLNMLLTNNEELIAAWQGYDAAVAAMEESLNKVKTHMSAFARTHALLTPQLVKGFFEVLRRFPTRDTGKPFVDILAKTATAGVEPIRKDHRDYQAALATVDNAQKKLVIIQKESAKSKSSNERQVLKLTEALRECERATTAVNIPKLQYQSKLQELQFTRALAVLELMASCLSVRATQHATCKGLMDSAGKEGKDLLAVSKKRQEEFSITKERNNEKIQQSMVFQSLRGAEIMNPDTFQARMMFVVTPILPASLIGEVVKRRLAQAIFLDADRFVPGEFILTRYRVAFVAYSFSKAETSKPFKAGESKAVKPDEPKTEMELVFSVPLVSLARIDEVEPKMAILTGKDLSTLSVSFVHCVKPEGLPLIQGENKADQYSAYGPAFWAEVRSFAFDWPFYAFEYCTKFRSSLAVPNTSPTLVTANTAHEDGWGVYAPVAEWSRLAVPNKWFRLSQINNEYNFSPTYPRWLVFPADADDNFMLAAGPFRSKNRCPTLHWCMRRRGGDGPGFVGIFGCSQPKVGFQGHRNPWDENLLDFCSGAEKGSNVLPERPVELKQSASALPVSPGPPGKKGHHKTSSTAWEITGTDGREPTKNKLRIFPWTFASSSSKPKAYTVKHPPNTVEEETQHQYLKLLKYPITPPYRIILIEKPNTTIPYYEIAADEDLTSVWDMLRDLPHPETLKDMKPEARANFVLDYLQKSARGSVNTSQSPVHDEDFDEDDESLESMSPDERAAYEHIKKLNEQQLDKSQSRPAVIVDCRPYVNALANVAKGYGWENTAVYKRCSVKFLGIPNIHVMRECLSQLRNLFLSMLKSDATLSGVQRDVDEDPYKHITLELRTNVDGCKWFKWLSLILEGAVGCARDILDNKPVIVHCSDGWDRTPQVIALTLLMLDPYFRTIRGLAILIEKEFLSYGHKFADRMGHEIDRANPKVKERSPVFLQWLDCVNQLVYQFPSHFEYDSRLLARLADHIFSCKYGTFFANCEKERTDELITTRTVSAWTPILSNARAFRSPHFGKHEGGSKENSLQRNSFGSGNATSADEGGVTIQDADVLLPKCGVSDMVLFTEFYQRWDPRKTAACSLFTSYEYNIPSFSHVSSPQPVSPPSMPPVTPSPSALSSLPQSISSAARTLPPALLRSIAQGTPRGAPPVSRALLDPSRLALTPASTSSIPTSPSPTSPTSGPTPTSAPNSNSTSLAPTPADWETAPRSRSGPSFGSGSTAPASVMTPPDAKRPMPPSRPNLSKPEIKSSTSPPALPAFAGGIKGLRPLKPVD